MVIKLDFRKVFNSVSWEALIKILLTRGFPNLFCQWIHSILLQTGKTAILLNRVLGPWIQCRNGLRHGDHISPYLYIIFSDILQQLIIKAFIGGELNTQSDAIYHQQRCNTLTTLSCSSRQQHRLLTS
jgi:hypothetical protein